MILLQSNSTTISIGGGEYPKDYVSLLVNSDGVSLTLTYNFNNLFENVLYSDFALPNEIEDEDPVPFASLPSLKKWWEENAYTLLSYAKPRKIVSAATTNQTLVKDCIGLLHSITAINASSSERYLKLYDVSEAPTAADVPVLTFVLPGLETVEVIEGEEIAGKPKASVNLIPSELKFYNGIGIAITGAVADNDETAIGAGEVVVNLIYQ